MFDNITNHPKLKEVSEFYYHNTSDQDIDYSIRKFLHMLAESIHKTIEETPFPYMKSKYLYNLSGDNESKYDKFLKHCVDMLFYDYCLKIYNESYLKNNNRNIVKKMLKYDITKKISYNLYVVYNNDQEANWYFAENLINNLACQINQDKSF